MPRNGHTLVTAVKEWAEPLDAAYVNFVETLSIRDRPKIASAYSEIFSPILGPGGEENQSIEEMTSLATSAILCIYLIFRAINRGKGAHSIQEAENWFLGTSDDRQGVTSIVPNWPPTSVVNALATMRFDDDFVEMFPYVVETLDSYSVVGSTAVPKAKRNLGLFYTPSDVSGYIVNKTLAPWNQNGRLHEPVGPLTIMDPACGSGIFLRSVLDWYETHQGTHQRSRVDLLRSVYGLDISPHAVQSCAFTLVLDSIKETPSSLPPWCLWQVVRGNLFAIDSTRVLGRGFTDPNITKAFRNSRQAVTKRLMNGEFFPLAGRSALEILHSRQSWPLLGDLFPEIASGCSAIVGNPPFSTEKKLSGTAYLPFVRMMWTLANETYSKAGMVVPLSIAYHSGAMFKEVRREMSSLRRKWQFAFFDRTPDSLFGDNVKTRNCIVFSERSATDHRSIQTTSLIRWNSHIRENLFSDITFTEIDNIHIDHMIPKLGTRLENSVYRTLRSEPVELGAMWSENGSQDSSSRPYNVYFRSTAYNWLPLFRNLPIAFGSATGGKMSRFNRLNLENAESADFVFAVGSSRLAYWLWRVEGDGFHLNEGFLHGLPFHPANFSRTDNERLSSLSRLLWEKLIQHPIQKFNAGVLAISYHPLDCASIIDEIDQVLVDACELPAEFSSHLRTFVNETIAAGRPPILNKTRDVQSLAEANA